MRLRELQEVLLNNLFFVKIDAQEVVIGGDKYINLQDASILRLALKNLAHAKIQNPILEWLQDSELFVTISDVIRVPLKSGRDIVHNISILRTTLDSLLHELNALLPPRSENSAYMRIGKTDNFDDIESACGTFKLLCNLCVRDAEGNYKINYVENGSLWLEVLFPTTYCLSILAAFARAALSLQRQYIENQLRIEELRQAKNESTRRESLTAAINVYNEIMLSNAAEIIKEDVLKKSPATIQEIQQILTGLTDQLCKGSTIQASLNNPEEVINMFPRLPTGLINTSKPKELDNG